MQALSLQSLSASKKEAPTEKGFKQGTHRIFAPEKTVVRVQGLFGLLGITRVANVTGLDSIGIPVVMVVRPNSRALAVSQGKGPNLAAAKASGVMESIESYHAERIQLPLLLASYNELRFSHPLVDLAALPRPAGNGFHENERILWIEGAELLSGEPRWLPFETVHQDFRIPSPAGSGNFLKKHPGQANPHGDKPQGISRAQNGVGAST